MQHGRKWSGEDIAGYYCSEKMDGCRGFWDGKAMWSRSGRRIQIPATWSKRLPRCQLEGEIWAGRGQWDATVAAVVRNTWAPHVGFIVFDAPTMRGDWAERVEAAKYKLRGEVAAVVPWCVVRDVDHVGAIVRAIRRDGGEGVILCRPGEEYRAGRSGNILKLKCDPLTGELAWHPRERNHYRSAA